MTRVVSLKCQVVKIYLPPSLARSVPGMSELDQNKVRFILNRTNLRLVQISHNALTLVISLKKVRNLSHLVPNWPKQGKNLASMDRTVSQLRLSSFFPKVKKKGN